MKTIGKILATILKLFALLIIIGTIPIEYIASILNGTVKEYTADLKRKAQAVKFIYNEFIKSGYDINITNKTILKSENKVFTIVKNRKLTVDEVG